MSTKSRLSGHHDEILAARARGEGYQTLAQRYAIGRNSMRDYCRLYVDPHVDREDAQAVAGDGEVTQEEVLRAELAELRARLAKGRKGDVAEERILQSVEAALAAVPAEAHVWDDLLIPPLDDDAHHRQVLVLSDFHGGERVDPDAVNGLNEYSWEIMEQRVDQLVDAVLSHKRRSPELTGLDVLFVGDMCSGSNHEELAVTNEYPLAEQAVRMGYLQAQLVAHLAERYHDVRVLVVVGNHPRLPKKPAAKQIHDNGDWIAGVVMKQALADIPHVSVELPRSAAAFHQVAGRTLYVWHGDGVRSSMPGVPWGGVMRRVNALQAQQHRRHIDHFVLGHFHQANVVQGGRVIMNGSLKGVDEWVLKSFGGGDAPTQLLLTFDERRERMTDVRYVTPTAGLPE